MTRRSLQGPGAPPRGSRRSSRRAWTRLGMSSRRGDPRTPALRDRALSADDQRLSSPAQPANSHGRRRPHGRRARALQALGDPRGPRAGRAVRRRAREQPGADGEPRLVGARVGAGAVDGRLLVRVHVDAPRPLALRGHADGDAARRARVGLERQARDRVGPGDERAGARARGARGRGLVRPRGGERRPAVLGVVGQDGARVARRRVRAHAQGPRQGGVVGAAARRRRGARAHGVGRPHDQAVGRPDGRRLEDVRGPPGRRARPRARRGRRLPLGVERRHGAAVGARRRVPPRAAGVGVVRVRGGAAAHRRVGDVLRGPHRPRLARDEQRGARRRRRPRPRPPALVGPACPAAHPFPPAPRARSACRRSRTRRPCGRAR